MTPPWRRRLGPLRTLSRAMMSLVILTACSNLKTDSMQQDPILTGQVRGGWNLKSPELVTSAAAAGITTAFLYGPPPSVSSPLGQALAHNKIKIVSGEVSDLVSAYECTRTQTVAPMPKQGRHAQYCETNPHYTRDALLADVNRLVARDRGNSLVAGYWVLDDTPTWDFGSLRPVLTDIRRLIPTGTPTLCGFSASLLAGGQFVWEPGLAENFSPEACTMVVPYIYADSKLPTDPPPSGTDWSMRGLLPEIKSSLSQNGWDESRQRMLGIGQAWSGRKVRNGAVTYPPSSSNMVSQAEGYCAAGAQGMIWYAWAVSGYTSLRTPANDASLLEGIRRSQGICPAGNW